MWCYSAALGFVMCVVLACLVALLDLFVVVGEALCYV